MPDYIDRYCVWAEHDVRCFWCEEPVLFRDVTVDHVIPSSTTAEDLVGMKREYGLPDEFQIESFENFVPAHVLCNIRKKTEVHAAHVMAEVFRRIRVRLPAVRESRERFRRDRRRAEALIHLQAAITDNRIVEADILDTLLELRRGPDGWIVLSEEHGTQRVTDGVRSGIRPTPGQENAHWMCPNCMAYGPWNGVICLECGRRSDPND